MAMRWSAADVRGTAASIAPWWSMLTAGVPDEIAASALPPSVARFMSDSAAPSTPPSVTDVEAALAALSEAGRELRRMGYGMAAGTGVIAGVFLGEGGLPKTPVASAEVAINGLVGDRQRTRKHHGRVWQALCLWSAEVVETLQAEGHGVFPGACGENVLIRGVSWSALRPGARLRIGSVLAEVSVPTIACKQIRPYFTAAAIRRIDHDRHPGFSRWYASVLVEGRVAVEDDVVVEPGA